MLSAIRAGGPRFHADLLGFPSTLSSDDTCENCESACNAILTDMMVCTAQVKHPAFVLLETEYLVNCTG